MTSKGLAFVVVLSVVVSACGGLARPEGRTIRTEPAVAEAPVTSSVGTRTSTTDVSPTSTPVTEPAAVGEEPAGSIPSTTATTLTSDVPTSTTTSPAESIDLAEVRDALDALDETFGGLDSHIDSVDLDEGETP